MKEIKKINITESKAVKLANKLNAKSVFGSIFESSFPYQLDTDKYMIMITEYQYLKYAK